MSITKKEQTESIINLEFPVGLQESFIHCLKLDFDFLSDLKLEEHWSIPEQTLNLFAKKLANKLANNFFGYFYFSD